MIYAKELAAYIINKCVDDGQPITNIQLQKILFAIQKKFLCSKTLNHSAFPDEIEAWQFGPVVPDVYYDYCGYGCMPIMRNQNVSDLNLSVDEQNTVDTIVETMRILEPWEINKIVCNPEGSWHTVYYTKHTHFKKSPNSNPIIPVRIIKELS